MLLSSMAEYYLSVTKTIDKFQIFLYFESKREQGESAKPLIRNECNKRNIPWE